ncbi:MAG: retention module-containing protein, partial [Thiomicrospira sp.]|nr:retention module-containing protein [Thiomicrospira sp.]
MAEQTNELSIGKVVSVDGEVYIKEASGEIVPLIEGMSVFPGQIIQSGSDGSLLVELSNGQIFTLGRNSQAALSNELIDGGDPEESQSTNESVQEAIKAVLAGNLDDLDETAAGEQEPTSSSLQSANAIDNSGAQGELTSGFDTTTFEAGVDNTEDNFGRRGQQEGSPETASANVNDTTDTTTLTLNDVAVDEGAGTATISATLDHAPTDEPLVIALDNDATITFDVGETTATSTPFSVQGDDAYIDGETITVNATVQSGGSEFENLVTTDTATVTVSDTIDTTTVSLSTSDVTEDSGVVTFTATLSNPGQ